MPTLFTVGHSNHTLADFLALLTENQIEHLADVRRFPGSRRYPHFGSISLAASLAAAGIGYTHFPELGGRRSGRAVSSPNSAWRIAAFAAYADYMLSDEFKIAFNELRTQADQTRTAIMCAEALPWRCHRRLIADQFIAQGWQVQDIISTGTTKPHLLPDFAVINNGQVTYPAATLFPNDD
jgi:uncharacterized protein (DUF488 family)